VVDPRSARAPGRFLRIRRLWAPLLRPVDGLTARILACVFAAAFTSSLAVAGLSSYSIDHFLRGELRLNFPAILEAAAERLDLWLSLRRLDIAAFAEGVPLAAGSAPGEPVSAVRAPALERTRAYLERLRARYPLYDTLLLLDTDGREVLSVGRRIALDASLRARFAAATQGADAVDRWLEPLDIHVFSAPVPKSSLSLHGLVHVSALADRLARTDLGAGRALYLVDRSGRVLLALGAHDGRRRQALPLPSPGSPPRVDEVEGSDGALRVSSAQAYRRFGWTLVVEEPAVLAEAPLAAVLRRILAANLGIAFAFSVGAVLLVTPLLRPLKRLSSAARQLAAAGDAELPDPGALPLHASSEAGTIARAFKELWDRALRAQRELGRSRREIDRANQRLAAQNEALRRVNEELEQLSITDELTCLHNRRFFREHLPREVKRAWRTGESMALVLFDIDDFKRLNDRYGHAVGDVVLRKVADVMSAHIRDMDLLARYGGEEFVLLASSTSLEGAVALSDKIRMAVAAASFPVVDLDGPSEISVTVSAGVACFRGDERDLFRDADRALYRAKASGKDCVCVG
jgi:diguanylate cyclase (GGDEF)-like protein